jgi:hypothetical protein
VKILGARGQKIKRRTNVRRKVNPKLSSEIGRHRARLSAATMIKRYGERALEVAARTRELSHTSKQREHWNKVIAQLEAMPGARPRTNPLRRRRAHTRARNPLPFHVGFKTGAPIANFRSLPRAAQYARALANKAGRAVRVYR